MSYNTAAIRQLLKSAFTDDDLAFFCYDHFRPVYEQFSSGQGYLVKIQLLIEYCDKQDAFESLLTRVKAINPIQYDKFSASIKDQPKSPKVRTNSGKSRAEIILIGDLSGLSLELKGAAVSAIIGALADVLDIPRDQINVLQVQTGSIILRVEMPTEALNRLMGLYEVDDPIIRGLGIQQVRTSIPFGDRDYHIDKIKADFAPPYYLLDAPAGYGKTELLMELKGRLSQEGWVCAYICADNYETPNELVKGLAGELGLKGPLTGRNVEQLGLAFGNLLRGEKRQDITLRGVVLLIDLGRSTSLSMTRKLAAEFIPKVQSSLRVDEFFDQKHNRFRVVLAGRHLAKQKDKIVEKTTIPLTVEQLPPLTYEDLLKTTREYLPKTIAAAVITQIATQIMHITGGHPGCMASLLRMYKKSGAPPPRDFFDMNGEEIQQVINREVDEIEHDIPAELRPAIDAIGIFRQVNLHILSFFIGQVPGIGDYKNAAELADKLTTAYYLRRDGPLLRNDNHRLLGLRRRADPDCAKRAQESCQDYLNRSSARKPEVWVIEYLYQFLLSLSGEVEDSSRRTKIQEKLLNEELPHILSRLVANKDHIEKLDIYETLKQELKKDDEFRFVVNYYTGKDQYGNQPYEELEKAIDQFFMKQRTGGTNA